MSTHTPENRLLAALPPPELARLIAQTTDITLGPKDLLYRAAGPMDHVYFPRSGVISAVVVMEDGQLAETAAVGREGMLGAATGLGATTSPEQVFCQVPPSECRRLPAAEFTAEVGRDGPLREIVHAYVCGSLAASARQTACNCLHPADERCARWILACHDRVGADEFPLTHEFLATMLGVRRATVTVTAGTLQSAGLIAYRHGRVRVLDRAGLEEAACECYRAIRDFLDPPA
jgi:CRP-like cAMP-binding protein